MVWPFYCVPPENYEADGLLYIGGQRALGGVVMECLACLLACESNVEQAGSGCFVYYQSLPFKEHIQASD